MGVLTSVLKVMGLLVSKFFIFSFLIQYLVVGPIFIAVVGDGDINIAKIYASVAIASLILGFSYAWITQSFLKTHNLKYKFLILILLLSTGLSVSYIVESFLQPIMVTPMIMNNILMEKIIIVPLLRVVTLIYLGSFMLSFGIYIWRAEMKIGVSVKSIT